MGKRSAVDSNEPWRRFGNYFLQPQDNCTRLRFRSNSIAWPALAQRLDSQFLLSSVEVVDGSIILDVKAPIQVLKNLLLGHRKKGRISLSVSLALGSCLVVPLAFVPFANSKDVAMVSASKTKSDPCATLNLENWLLGDKAQSYISLESSINMGGVLAGTLVCEKTRYSYALGFEEPKRVLIVKKLDS